MFGKWLNISLYIILVGFKNRYINRIDIWETMLTNVNRHPSSPNLFGYYSRLTRALLEREN